MPTLFRLIAVLAVLVGLFYGAMLGLVWYVHPKVGVISERVPVEKLEAGHQQQKTVAQ